MSEINRHTVSKIVIQTLRRLNIPFMCGGVLVGDCSTCGDPTISNLLEFDEATNTITSTVNGTPASVVITLSSADLITENDLTIEGVTYPAGTPISTILWALASAGPTGYLRSVFNVSSDTIVGNNPFTDYYYFVSGDTTITLPTAIMNTGRYSFKNVGLGIITINPIPGQLIDGSDAQEIYFTNNSIDIMSDGTNWMII